MLRLVMPQALTVARRHRGVGGVPRRHRLRRLPPRRPSSGAATAGCCAQRRFEDDGRWYRRRLRIHRWKDRLPDAGDLFRGGMSKRQLPTYDVAGLTAFARETRRAELAHWWALFCGPLFVLWNPPLAAALLVTYGVLVNLPFIAIQRYNRFKFGALLGVWTRVPSGGPAAVGLHRGPSLPPGSNHSS